MFTKILSLFILLQTNFLFIAELPINYFQEVAFESFVNCENLNQNLFVKAVELGEIEYVKNQLKKNKSNILAKDRTGKDVFNIALEQYEKWYKKYKEDKIKHADLSKSWLRTAIQYKEIAKLIFDKFIEQNPNLLCNPNLLKIVNEYNLNLTQEEIEVSNKQ